MTPVNAAPHHTGQRPAPAGLFRAPKIQPWHLDRLAVVYVRQSTPQQVAENQESTDRQYALANRAIELGWPPDRILVIDDDQGKSGPRPRDGWASSDCSPRSASTTSG